MTELVEFITARLKEDERIATAAADPGGPHWPDADGEMWTSQLVHARRHDPARVLREVEAKHLTMEEHDPAHDPCDAHDGNFETIPCPTLCLLALPYVDHSDYREEWRP
jgi:hypothetical protein